MRMLNPFTVMLKIITILLLSSFNGYSQLTVTKTYTAPSSISIDGCGIYCATLPGVTFSAADFTSGFCQITDVNVSITWLKTDGTCDVPLTGSSFHGETNFRLDGPSGNNVILLKTLRFTGNGSTPITTTILDQSAATEIGGIDPVDGTFRPNDGNLDTYNGTSAFGTWFLRAGDVGVGDPLCIFSYSVTITVSNDNIAPVPNLASLPNINAECSVTSLTAPTATDNCSGTVTGTHNATLPITASGTTVITWTYTDGNGNSSTQTQNVVINDITAPVPNVATLANITAVCSVTSLTAPTATDNCSGLVTGTHNATLPITASGTTVVTWTYTDVSGNDSTQTQNVIIEDPIPPVITLSGSNNISLCIGSTYSDAGATAADNCDGDMTVDIVVNNLVNTSIPGIYTITYNVSDAAGNPATQVTRTVEVYELITVADGNYSSPSTWLGGCLPPNPIPNGVTVQIVHDIINDMPLTNNGTINATGRTFVNNSIYQGDGSVLGNFTNNGSFLPGND